MVFFKCKMCGGTVEFEQGATVGVCDSCGTKQTLPRLDDDKKANLYDRANHYLGKLMAELKVRKPEQLADCKKPFDKNINYQKVMHFGDEKLTKTLTGYIKHINERNEFNRKNNIYEKAVRQMNEATKPDDFAKARDTFKSIPGFKDADALVVKAESGIYDLAVKQMNEATAPEDFAKARDTFKYIPGFKDADTLAVKAETGRKNAIYDSAAKLMSNNNKKSFQKAINVFNEIPDWKDTKEQLEICNKRIVEITEQEEKERKDTIYQSAVDLMKKDSSSAYSEAISAFKTIPNWKDVDEQIRLCEQRIDEIKADEQAKAEAWRIAAIEAEKKRKKMTAIIASVGCACFAFIVFISFSPIFKHNYIIKSLAIYGVGFVFLLTRVIIPRYKYNTAIKTYESGNVIEAYESLVALNGYKNSADKAKSIFDKYTMEKLKVAQAGDSVFFGSYEQDNNTSDGKENIEWIVLEKEDKKALLISKYALDCQKYDSENTWVTWESCILRKWLNGTFLNNAFGEKQQEIILDSITSAEKNPSYNIDSGNTTTDKVFLLSITEAEKYFSTDEARKCVPTEYAKANGAYTSSSYTKGGAGTCCWWLRSLGYSQFDAASVYSDGSVHYSGLVIQDDNGCVRPAIWLNIAE